MMDVPGTRNTNDRSFYFFAQRSKFILSKKKKKRKRNQEIIWTYKKMYEGELNLDS